MSLLFIGFDQRSMLRLSFHKTTSKYIEHGTLKQLTPLFLIDFDEAYGNIETHSETHATSKVPDVHMGLVRECWVLGCTRLSGGEEAVIFPSAPIPPLFPLPLSLYSSR